MASCYKKDHKIIRIQINSEFSSGQKNRISPLFVESPDFGGGAGRGGGEEEARISRFSFIKVGRSETYCHSK